MLLASKRCSLLVPAMHGVHLSQRLMAAATGTLPVPVVHGRFEVMPDHVQQYVVTKAKLCRPDKLHICDGSKAETDRLLHTMQAASMVIPLPKYDNCWLSRTNPADVARVESKTMICTKKKQDTIPEPTAGTAGMLGNWKDPTETETLLGGYFDGCMKGRTMYVLPYVMGPSNSPLSKVGVELTDSPYVVQSMNIMTRTGHDAWGMLSGGSDFVRCLHSVGVPLPQTLDKYNWPCNPEKTLIAHFPDRKEIMSFGSGYGGNSLLGKKCFALRIASCLARDEGWLAEHMLILGVTNPKGEKIYVAAAFPSACGKTNMAMMVPQLPGWKVECVGDDIAWMKFDADGVLRAINPEAGFFGVCPGTSHKTNPVAMQTIFKDTIFTNVASTSDGGVFWEGMEPHIDLSKVKVTSWLNQVWTGPGSGPAAHPNSRFCSPITNCPILDPKFNSTEGVPISAIIFGGRRPAGVPLVYEAFNWNHGVFVGASLKSETTAAAEYTGKQVMNDPFAMRPFFGYNAGHYLKHWLSFAHRPGLKLPKIFHVNWFRKSKEGKFLWPGYGENARVLDWMFGRCQGQDSAMQSPIGYLPKPGAIDTTGMNESIDWEELMSVPKDFWLKECDDLTNYFTSQFNQDLPAEIRQELNSLHRRLH